MFSKYLFHVAIATTSLAASVDLKITNQCSDTIWPAINTQAGTGPSQSGFELKAGDTQNLTVDTNWNGRVWGRTNCTFDGQGRGNCLTGDCGGVLACTTAASPVTLAEFNLPGGLSQSYYDISLVDGYNLPLAIEAILYTNSSSNPRSNTTNPSCVASLEGLSSTTFDPYSQGATFLNTSSQYPLPFETKLSTSSIANWCPRDLKLQAAQNGNSFIPCQSPCEKYKLGIYCCTGSYGSAKKCHPNYYAAKAKEVCPDAYSYAYDDASSTFTTPTGSGFEVIFCPGGRSTKILRTLNPSAASLYKPSASLIWAVCGLVFFNALL